MSLMQQQIKSAMWSKSTLGQFLHVQQDNAGNFASLHHASLLGITASQHHNRIHATSHYPGASDPIRLATSGRDGFMNTTHYKKVSSLVASGTRNAFKASKYVGAGASRQVTLGWQPDFVKVWQAGSQGRAFEWMWSGAAVIIHGFAPGTGAHEQVTAALQMSTAVSGFTVRGSCIVADATYLFWAIKEY